MTSFSDNSKKTSSKPRSVVFVIYPDIVLLDLAGPLQVFSSGCLKQSTAPAYDTAVVSLGGGRVTTDTLIPIETASMSSWMRRSIHTLVVVGGMGAMAASQDKTFIKSLTRLITRAERVCSVCSGALLLAATGILDGRRAVTHWEDCSQLQQLHPQVKVELDPIFVKDGDVWTSAGITAGIDMALAMVADDLGQPAALEIARSLVTYMVRPGGQSQFSPALDRQALDQTGRFSELHSWIAEHLHLDLRVEELAARLNMSVRNFSRVYTSQMGRTPAKAVEAFRIEAARNFLETTSLSIKVIAVRCGFVDDERMRRAFMRCLHIPPNEYRRRFQNVAHL